MKKYEMTDETIVLETGETLHRIRALRDFGDVKRGDLGGFIEREYNLSHDDTSWIYNDAKVYSSARIADNAKVYDNCEVSEYANVYGCANLHGNAKVYGYANLYGCAFVRENARVYDRSWLHGNVFVGGDADISGSLDIGGRASFIGNAKITDEYDFISISNIGIGATTFFRRADGTIGVNFINFYGSLYDFVDYARTQFFDNKIVKKCMIMAELAETHFDD